MTRPRTYAIVGALVVAAVVATGIVVLRSSDEPSAVTATTPAATTPTVTPVPPPSPLPERVPGLELAPVEIGTYRISLVFRLRNTILNGLPVASDYTLKTLQAKQGEDSGLLLGVALIPGATGPNVGRSIRGLIDVPTVLTEQTSGRLLTIHQVSGYNLAVLDVGPRRTIVAIATERATARRMAAAVAKAVAGER